MSAQPRVTTDVVWLVNPKDEPPVIGYHHSRIVVFPSAVGQNSPVPEGKTRTELPKPGTLEKCTLFLARGERSYTAYPLSGTVPLELPGATSPLELTWEENLRESGCITTVFINPEETRYARIFPAGENPQNPAGTVNWQESPQPGETHLCLIQYTVPASGNVVGHAYPYVGLEIDVQHGVIFILEVGFFVPEELGWEAKAERQEEKIVITLSPQS